MSDIEPLEPIPDLAEVTSRDLDSMVAELLRKEQEKRPDYDVSVGSWSYDPEERHLTVVLQAIPARLRISFTIDTGTGEVTTDG